MSLPGTLAASPKSTEPEPLFDDPAVSSGGGALIEIHPMGGPGGGSQIGVMVSPFTGMSASMHYVGVTGHRLVAADGSYLLVIGAADGVQGWTSSAGLAASTQVGYGAVTDGALKLYALGTGALDTSLVYRGINGNYASAGLGGESGAAVVNGSTAITVGVTGDVVGTLVNEGENLAELRGGVRVRADLKRRLYLRVDLDRTLAGLAGASGKPAAKLFLDVRVCKICMASIGLKAERVRYIGVDGEAVERTDLVIGVQGGLSY